MTPAIQITIRVELDPAGRFKSTVLNFEPDITSGPVTKSKGRPVTRHANDILPLLGSKGLKYSQWRDRAKWELGLPKSTFGRLLRELRKARQVEKRGQKYFSLAGEGPGQGEGRQNPFPLRGKGFDPNAQGPEPTLDETGKRANPENDGKEAQP